MSDIDRLARHVPVEDRPEVRLFAAELRLLYDSLDMSLGLFCKTNPNIDKGSLSRYLNGKRVPRDRWFLDRLFALRVEAGTPITDEVRDHLIGLQLAALQVSQPHDYRVREVTDQLNDTVTALRESKRHITAMEHELAERTRRLTDLTAANEKLRTAWDTERLTTQQAIDDLTAQLALARKNHTRAEEHRRELEDLLDQLDTTHPDTRGSDAASAGARFPAAVEALQARFPQQRTAAIRELADIAQQTPTFYEAVIGTLLGHLRNTTITLQDNPSSLPAAAHHTEPLHAAIRTLLQLKDRRLPRANLTGADLTRADLTEADLSGADLSGADLNFADLNFADLRGADLTGADLSGATLIMATLIRANLSRANLSEVDLAGAYLSGADLSEVDLRKAKLTGADLSGVYLRRVNLTEANLREVDLTGVIGLSEAYLRGADLTGADLSGVDLRGADLSGATLSGAALIMANLNGADLRGANLTRANLTGADLGGADLNGANLSNANLREVDLRGVDLRGPIGLPEGFIRRAERRAAKDHSSTQESQN